MKKAVAAIFLSILMIPIIPAFSQVADTSPTLALKFTTFSPYYYKAEDGTTVVIGEVENIKNFPLTGVKIRVNFYDDINPQPIESTVGSPILEVIPPKSKSPYIIKSPSPNSAITP